VECTKKKEAPEESMEDSPAALFEKVTLSDIQSRRLCLFLSLLASRLLPFFGGKGSLLLGQREPLPLLALCISPHRRKKGASALLHFACLGFLAGLILKVTRNPWGQ
jgi:hypothetical protein